MPRLPFAAPPLIAALMTVALPAAPAGAASFDCARASTPEERMICGVPALDRADAAVGAAYKALADAVAGDETARGIARGEQRAWLTRRNRGCGFGPDALAGVADPAACLDDAMTRRVRQLAALRADPALGARLRTVTVTEGKPGARVFIQADRPEIADPAHPGAAAFNEAMQRFIAGEIRTFRTDSADLPEGMESELFLTADAFIPAPGVISVQFLAEGVQGNGFRFAAGVTLDLTRGRSMSPGEMFGTGNWLATATAACRTAVADMPENCVAADLQNPRNWRFEPGRGVLTLLLPGKELREIPVPTR